MMECSQLLLNAVKYLRRFNSVIWHILSLQRRPLHVSIPDTCNQLYPAVGNARRILTLLLNTIIKAKQLSSNGRHIRWGIFTPLMRSQYYLSIGMLALFPHDPAMRKFSLVFSLLCHTNRSEDPFAIEHPGRTQLIYWIYALGSTVDYVGETIQWEKRLKSEIRGMRSYTKTRKYHKSQNPHLKLFRLGNATGYTRMISLPIIIMGTVDINNTTDENNFARTNRQRMEQHVMEWIRPVMNMKRRSYMHASLKSHNPVPLSRHRPVFLHAVCKQSTPQPCTSTCRNLSNTQRRMQNLTYWEASDRSQTCITRHSLAAILDDLPPNQPIFIS